MLEYYKGFGNAQPLTGVRRRGASLNKKVATYVRDHVQTLKGDEVTAVRYHDTDIVMFNDERITLFTGSWFTPTTKRRMNQASAEYGLGFSVVQEQSQWRVYHHLGKVDRFANGSVTFNR